MRLIVHVNYSDDCTYSFTETYPVVYESAEKFAVDFQAKCEELRDKPFLKREFSLGGNTFNAGNSFYNGEFVLPAILTIDEWFAQVAANV